MSMGDQNGNKTLFGLKAICDYLVCSKPTFYQFIEMGLPARIHKKRWYAHKDNIDSFFKAFTHNRVTKIDEDAD